MKIGKKFELEKVGESAQDYPSCLGADIQYCMSGRCALYYCLKEISLIDRLKCAYVPAYTCETVLDSYLKAGYKLKFYDVDPDGLSPLYRENDLDGVSVFALCGYYGFSSYDFDFAGLCRSRGIIVLQDTTHNPFEPHPEADFLAGSLRKWMGIACGGIAVKRNGYFSEKLLDVDWHHIEGRYKYLDIAEGNADNSDSIASVFWENELGLRRSFDAYGSDQLSIDIIEHFPYSEMIRARRDNYRTLLDHLVPSKGWKPVFKRLDENACPSHFSIYADRREELKGFLAEREISSTTYWPVPPMINQIGDYPGAGWVYEHIMSVQVDQRYNREHMQYLASSLNEYTIQTLNANSPE